MVKEIKKINKISLANIVGIVYAFLGFLFSILFYSYFLIKILLRTDILVLSWTDFGSNFLYALIFSLLIAIFSGLMSWILGFLIACLYNFFSPKIGGIKLETEDKDFKAKLFKNY